MRARNLKPSFFKNEDLAELKFEERLLFAGLWCLSDRDGFFENRPKKIKAELFPYDEKITPTIISKMLCNLMSRHVITLNETHGLVNNFLKHNNPHPHEAKSCVSEEIKNTLKKLCNDMSLACQCNVVLNPESCILNPESCIPLIVADDIAGFFDSFWKAYPKKIGKGAAEKSFKKIKPTESLLRVMISAIENFKESENWKEKNGKYIPNPATWLNQKRWEDEVPEESKISKMNPAQQAVIEAMENKLKKENQEQKQISEGINQNG